MEKKDWLKYFPYEEPRDQQEKVLNKVMNKAATSILHDVDIILFIIELDKWTEIEDNILSKYFVVYRGYLKL